MVVVEMVGKGGCRPLCEWGGARARATAPPSTRGGGRGTAAAPRGYMSSVDVSGAPWCCTCVARRTACVACRARAPCERG